VIPASVCVRSYAVTEKHGAVWVWMGSAERLDESLIPPIIGPDEPDWVVPTGVLDIRADAALVGDNLLDLSHAPWVHGATFVDNNETSFRAMMAGEASTQVERIDRGVLFRRWHLGRPSNPFVDVGPTDDYLVNHFLAPGVFILKTRCYRTGIQERQGGDHEPTEEPLLMRSTSQMITPVNDRESKFFYTFGIWSKHAAEAPKAFAIAEKAFHEDKFIIEEQQSTMDRSPGVSVMNLAMDAPLVRYHGIVRKLLEADGAAPPLLATESLRATAAA
jgi:phenylpropionate dioxygenase-like ring-hydroxylating dioxygenase large terminal subunit